MRPAPAARGGRPAWRTTTPGHVGHRARRTPHFHAPAITHPRHPHRAPACWLLHTGAHHGGATHL